MANNDASKILKCLETLARQTGIAIRLLHHSRKGLPGTNGQSGMEEMRGAGAIAARAAVVEQVIPKWSDGICYPSIGGDKVELKYRNTPKPAQRHYKITPVRIGLEKHPAAGCGCIRSPGTLAQGYFGK